MFYKLKDRIDRARFADRCEAVLRTAPIAMEGSSRLALVSQLQHKDVIMFLLAVKSFVRRVRPGAIFVLNDGSLTPDDRRLLQSHLPGVTFLELATYRSPACPAGGTWERLLAIASLISEHYVVQLDSDTLTVGFIEEVRDCVSQGRAFALGTWDRQTDESMAERLQTARGLAPSATSHVQLVAEANFGALKEFSRLRYVRGCSGFAGFPRRSFTRSFVEEVSAQMRSAIGAKWSEWGSEQVMSNIVLANIPGAMVLPHPKYADCLKMKPDETAFVHFIGTCRFSNGTYARLGRELIAAL